MTALHTALRRPRPCAVVVGFSGALLKPEVLGEEIKTRPPVLLVPGDADPVVPFGALALAEDALHLHVVPDTPYSRPALRPGIDTPGLRPFATGPLRHLYPEAPCEHHPTRIPSQSHQLPLQLAHPKHTPTHP